MATHAPDDDPYLKALEEWDAIEPMPMFSVTSVATTETTPGESTVDGNETEEDCEKGLSSDINHRLLSHGSVVSKAPSIHFMPSIPNSFPSSSTELETITEYIDGIDLSGQMPRIQHRNKKKSKILLFMKKALLLTPKKIYRYMRPERDRIMALALKPFDNNEPVHLKMLTILYQQLTTMSRWKQATLLTTTSPSLSCPRIGSHWESIGFQGIDPASDLRGVGLLGLYQLCFFVLSPYTWQLAFDVFVASSPQVFDGSSSLSVDSSFPFAVMGLNLTQISLYCLRKGFLNREINRRGSPVFLTFNLFYANLFMKFLAAWKSKQDACVSDVGSILRDIRVNARKKVRQDILEVLSYGDMRERFELNDISRGVEPTETSVIFSDIGNIVETNVGNSIEEEDKEEKKEVDKNYDVCSFERRSITRNTL